MKCSDPIFLKRLGKYYKSLLLVGNKAGHNPYPNVDICPTKYFVLLHNRMVSLGIPEDLEKQICELLNSVEAEDFAESMKNPLPVEKRFNFSWGMMQVSQK